jgi:hypothetical protein
VDRGTNSTDVPINSNDPINWQPVIANFGQLTNGISQLRLKKDNPDYILPEGYKRIKQTTL